MLFFPLEKAVATHSCFLAWRNLWTEELGRLQSMGLQRVRHNLLPEQIVSGGSMVKNLPAKQETCVQFVDR